MNTYLFYYDEKQKVPMLLFCIYGVKGDSKLDIHKRRVIMQGGAMLMERHFYRMTDMVRVEAFQMMSMGPRDDDFRDIKKALDDYNSKTDHTLLGNSFLDPNQTVERVAEAVALTVLGS